MKTKDPSVIRFLLEPMQDFIEKEEMDEYDLSAFIKWLRQNIANPLVGLWIAVKEEKVFGYCITRIHTSLLGEYVNEYVDITQIYGLEEKIEDEFLDIISKWAKKYGINKVAMHSKHPKRRWLKEGFVVKSHLMSKEV